MFEPVSLMTAGDVRKHAGAVLRANQQSDRVGGSGGAAPLHVDAALRLVQQILDVGAGIGVDGDAAAARNVADDFVSRNRIAAFRAEDHQIVLAADLQAPASPCRSMRLTVETRRSADLPRCLGLRRGYRFAERVGNNLARGKFAVTQVREQIFELRASVFGRDAQQIRFRNFLQAASRLPRFALEQAASDFGGLLALDEVDPLADFAARARSAHEVQPVAAGHVAFLREDFDHIAVGQAMPQRNDLAVHLCADALIADFGVNGVGKIDGRRAARQRHDVSLRREGVNFFGIQIHLAAWTGIP